ncbi:MAG TPA: hypothetical protein VLI21_08480, partial [Casimicrobiaceae bacterium]|nr:hypothetical protein [Casimicrobiaceae bacterium]
PAAAVRSPAARSGRVRLLGRRHLHRTAVAAQHAEQFERIYAEQHADDDEDDERTAADAHATERQAAPTTFRRIAGSILYVVATPEIAPPHRVLRFS